eukprot:g2408.t1
MQQEQLQMQQRQLQQQIHLHQQRQDNTRGHPQQPVSDRMVHNRNVEMQKLAILRALQPRLLHVEGLPPAVANEQTLRRYEFFGQYGTIANVLMTSKLQPQRDPQNPNNAVSTGAFLVFTDPAKARAASIAVNGFELDGYKLHTSFEPLQTCDVVLGAIDREDSNHNLVRQLQALTMVFLNPPPMLSKPPSAGSQSQSAAIPMLRPSSGTADGQHSRDVRGGANSSSLGGHPGPESLRDKKGNSNGASGATGNTRQRAPTVLSAGVAKFWDGKNAAIPSMEIFGASAALGLADMVDGRQANVVANGNVGGMGPVTPYAAATATQSTISGKKPAEQRATTIAQPGAAAAAGDSSNVDSRSPAAATAPGAISSATPPASPSPTVSQTLSKNGLDTGKNGRKGVTATTAKGETGQGSFSVNQAKHGEKKYAAEDQSARGKQRRGGNKRSKVPKASNPQAFAAGAAAAAAAKARLHDASMVAKKAASAESQPKSTSESSSSRHATRPKRKQRRGGKKHKKRSDASSSQSKPQGKSNGKN